MKENTKLFKMVQMDEYQITDEQYPIIGTQALYTCFGVLLYDENQKIAIVAHISSLGLNILEGLIELIYNYNFKYLIIPGSQSIKKDPYYIENKLIHFFKLLNVKEMNIKSQVNLDNQTNSYEFAFDSRTGKFISDRVLYGKEYSEIHNFDKHIS